jgi:hypothetical protein
MFMKRLMLITILMLLGCVAIQAQVGSNACDRTLWPRVYSRYRFATPVDAKNKKEPPHRCVKIKGRIHHIKPVSDDGDGDIHISVVPDNKRVLRPGQTFLVLEIICADNTRASGQLKPPARATAFRLTFHTVTSVS